MASGSYYTDPKTGKRSFYEAVSPHGDSGSGLGSRADYAKRLMQAGYSSDEAITKAYGTGGASGTTSKTKKAVDPYAEIKKQQDALLAAQKQARINALSGQRQSALGALSAERATVAPEFLKQRGTLSTTAQQAARGEAQKLAAQGLTRGGSSIQGDIARNVALQQGMSDIGQAEAGTLANIAQRQTGAEQAYAQGVAQAESEAAATAAQNEIARLMQAQQAQEASVAQQAQAAFEQQKLDQEQANKLQIEQLRIAAQEANAQGDFARARELAKYKNDLESETIKLRASTGRSSGGGGGSTSTVGKLNTTQSNIAKALASRIDSGAESLQAILARITDPAVKAYLIQIYGQGGATNNIGALTGLPTSRTIAGTNVSIPSWLNVRNLPGLE